MEKKSEIELHVHPYFNKYGLEEIVKAMDNNRVNIAALEFLNGRVFESIHLYAKSMAKKGYGIHMDSKAARIEKEGKYYYLIRAAELTTEENFHILTIGGDNIKPYQPINKMVEEAINQDSLVILDHIFVNNEDVSTEISRQQERIIRKTCRKNSGGVALEWNGYCIPWLRKLLGGRDVNNDVIKLSKTMERHNYNIPVVTDTDLHARNKNALKMIGMARIKSEINLDSGTEIISSLKNNIFSGKYENVYRTVPFRHFLPHFALPYVLNMFYKRPRG